MNTPVVTVRVIEWTPEFAISIPGIDREHQDWFEVLNRLHAAMLEGRGTQVLTSLLAEMTQYTLDHFAREEDSWRARGIRKHVNTPANTRASVAARMRSSSVSSAVRLR